MNSPAVNPRGVNIPLHTGSRARLLRAAIDWRSRAIRQRETLAGYRVELPHRSPLIQSLETLIARADQRVVELFSAAAGTPEGMR